MTLGTTPCPFVFGDTRCGFNGALAGQSCDKTIEDCRRHGREFAYGGLVGRPLQIEMKVSGAEAMLAVLRRNQDTIRGILAGPRPLQLDPYLDWKLQQG